MRGAIKNLSNQRICKLYAWSNQRIYIYIYICICGDYIYIYIHIYIYICRCANCFVVHIYGTTYVPTVQYVHTLPLGSYIATTICVLELIFFTSVQHPHIYKPFPKSGKNIFWAKSYFLFFAFYLPELLIGVGFATVQHLEHICQTGISYILLPIL